MVPRRGDSRNRTGDQGVADPRLTATLTAFMPSPGFCPICSVNYSVTFCFFAAAGATVEGNAYAF